jgi:hypothetical protein
MKTNEPQKTKMDEAMFAAMLVIVLFLIIPSLPLGKYGGGIAMFVVSVIGLIAYLVVFGRRLRGRGQLKTFAVVTASSFAASAAIAGALVLMRGHWH